MGRRARLRMLGKRRAKSQELPVMQKKQDVSKKVTSQEPRDSK